jgi:hypothetical protein
MSDNEFELKTGAGNLESEDTAARPAKLKNSDRSRVENLLAINDQRGPEPDDTLGLYMKEVGGHALLTMDGPLGSTWSPQIQGWSSVWQRSI